jgi:hypothetical protein
VLNAHNRRFDDITGVVQPRVHLSPAKDIRVKPLRHLDEASTAMLARLHTWGNGRPATVASLAPDTFDDYCIVWHLNITVADDAAPDQRFEHGTLPPDTIQSLAANLEPFGTSDHWILAFWDGYGWQPEPTAARTQIPHRRLILYNGSPRDVGQINLPPIGFQSPTLWWPTTRDWIVRTDVDSYYSVVAGTHACINHILKATALPTQRVDITTDLETLERSNHPS